MGINNVSENVKEYLNAWELRTLILLSLLLQILLAVFGNRRKYMTGRWLGVFVWIAYLSADWVATFSLGLLARSQGNGGKSSIPLFWAPALLVLLGGPDTITAYSLEDNELGLRRLLEAITQVVVTSYALIKLWSKDNLPFVAIPIFLVGLHKYGERIWTLRLASSKKLRASSIYEKYRLRRDFNRLIPGFSKILFKISIEILTEAKFLHEAHMLFKMFKMLLSNLLLEGSLVGGSRYIISLHAKEIFKLIEVELGFAYDVLYTKITGVQFSGRIVLRSIGFLLTISTLVVFSTTINKLQISKIDIFISYILLVGAIVLEIYSIMVFLFSDWTMLWIRKQDEGCVKCFCRAIWSSRLRSFFNNDNKRWSGLMAQHDILIDFQLRENLWDKCLKALVDKGAKIQGWKEVSADLKELIFNRLLLRSRTNTIESVDSLRTALEERGSEVLRRKNCDGEFGWSVVDLDFHQSLLVWHIATSVCYWDEFHKNREPGSALDPRCKMSQSLSNYMMYLLVEYPLMLPKGISEARYHATKDEMEPFVIQRAPDLSDRTSWNELFTRIQQMFPFQEMHEFLFREIKKETSAFRCGLFLAKSLVEKNFGSSGEKWEMIREMWLEMLIYAAGQCEWREHAQALTRGGELITFVSLLKAHLGLTLQREASRWHSTRIEGIEERFEQMVTRLTGTDRRSPSLTETVTEADGVGSDGDETDNC